MAKETRRKKAEVLALVEQIDQLHGTGVSIDEACKRVDLAHSVYRRYKQKGKAKPKPKAGAKKAGAKGGGVRGSVSAASIPPRPKKGNGKWNGPRPVNLHDIGSVAKRIGVIDRRVKGVEYLLRERKRLAMHLMEMLKKASV